VIIGRKNVAKKFYFQFFNYKSEILLPHFAHLPTSLVDRIGLMKEVDVIVKVCEVDFHKKIV